jgi:hypothetical protein
LFFPPFFFFFFLLRKVKLDFLSFVKEGILTDSWSDTHCNCYRSDLSLKKLENRISWLIWFIIWMWPQSGSHNQHMFVISLLPDSPDFFFLLSGITKDQNSGIMNAELL